MDIQTGKLYILKRKADYIAHFGKPILVIVADQKTKEYARIGKESYTERLYVLYDVDSGRTYEYSEWMLGQNYEFLSPT